MKKFNYTMNHKADEAYIAKLWEGRYSPVWDRMERNTPGRTREEYKEKLAKLILQMKAEIAALRNGTAVEYTDSVSPKKKQYLGHNPGMSNKCFLYAGHLYPRHIGYAKAGLRHRRRLHGGANGSRAII